MINSRGFSENVVVSYVLVGVAIPIAKTKLKLKQVLQYVQYL